MKKIPVYAPILVAEDKVVEKFYKTPKIVNMHSNNLVTSVQRWEKVRVGRNMWKSMVQEKEMRETKDL